MSLLNQMLKDLEQRRGSPPANNPVAQGVHSVSAAHATVSTRFVAGAVGALALVGACAYGYMQYTQYAPPERPNRTPADATLAVAAEPQAAGPPEAPALPALETANTPANAAAEATQAPAAPPAPLAADPQAAPTPPAPALARPAPAPMLGQQNTAANAQKLESPRQKANRLYQRALDGLQEGKTEEATAALRATLEADPSLHTARESLAFVLVQRGQTDAAQALLKDGLAWPQGAAGLAPLAARLALEKGDQPTAERWLQQGLAQSPQDAMLNGLMGTTLREQNRCQEASGHYLKALQRDPSMPGWLVGVALCWESMGLRLDAREALERAARSGRLNTELRAFVDDKLQRLEP
jgi:MSHA biogenesis protein MshN